jgi:ArsR family transcriptional regulator
MKKLGSGEAHLLHSQCCQAISDPKRILIVYTLHAGERNVSDLAKHLGLPQSTVSRHLKELLNRGMVASRRDGPSVIYSLTDERLIDALDIMRQVLADSLRRQAQLVDVISDQEDSIDA